MPSNPFEKDGLRGGYFKTPTDYPIRLLPGDIVNAFPSRPIQRVLASHRIVETNGAGVQVRVYIAPKGVAPTTEHIALEWTGAAGDIFQEATNAIESPFLLIPPGYELYVQSVVGTCNYFAATYEV